MTVQELITIYNNMKPRFNAVYINDTSFNIVKNNENHNSVFMNSYETKKYIKRMIKRQFLRLLKKHLYKNGVEIQPLYINGGIIKKDYFIIHDKDGQIYQNYYMNLYKDIEHLYPSKDLTYYYKIIQQF